MSETEHAGFDGVCCCAKESVEIFEAPDVPGAFIAHCHRMDVVTQARNEEEAYEAIKEACSMVIHYNAVEHTCCSHPWMGEGPQLVTLHKK